MQGSNNPFTADNENSVLNGSWREGKFRLKYATNFKGQLQRFHKLSLFDRFRHVENGLDINF